MSIGQAGIGSLSPQKNINKVRPNIFCNADYKIFNEGTSRNGIASPERPCDCVRITGTHGSAALDTARNLVTVIPKAVAGHYSSQILTCEVDTVETPAVADSFQLTHFIEGRDFAALYDVANFYISFWTIGTVAQTLGFSCSNDTDSESITFPLPIINGTTHHVFQIPGRSFDGTNWLKDNGVGLRPRISLMAGTNFLNGTSGWQAGNFLGRTGMDNFMDTVARIISFSQFAITEAPPQPGYPDLPFQEVLQNCARYYQKTFQPFTMPVQNIGSADGSISIWGQTHSLHNVNYHFHPPMRTTPSFDTYNPFAANVNWRNIPDATDSVRVSYDLNAVSQGFLKDTDSSDESDRMSIHGSWDAGL